MSYSRMFDFDFAQKVYDRNLQLATRQIEEEEPKVEDSDYEYEQQANV